MSFSISGKRAFVGGGSRGIGLGCAVSLADAGATVTIAARDETALARAVKSLPGASHSYVVADTSRPDDLRDIIGAEITRGGPIEILVNNTGGPAPGRAVDASPAEFAAAYTMHVVAGQALVAAVLPGMVESGYGRIINIISTSVVTPLANLGVSNTVRGAVAQWGRTLASELAPHGITVNNVLPGSIDTTRLRTTMTKMAEQAETSVEDIEAKTIASIPLGRLGRPDDIGDVVAFLASPAARYLTGVNIPVDGGKTAVQ